MTRNDEPYGFAFGTLAELAPLTTSDEPWRVRAYMNRI